MLTENIIYDHHVILLNIIDMKACLFEIFVTLSPKITDWISMKIGMKVFTYETYEAFFHQDFHIGTLFISDKFTVPAG